MRFLWIFLAAPLWAQSPPPKSPPELQRESIAKQKESIRTQARTAGTHLIPGDPAPQPPCDPMEVSVLDPIIESAAKAQQLAPNLIRAVIEQESAFRPCALSIKGAQGLMQLMPDTADRFSVADPFDPRQNIEAGTKYLKQLIDKYKGNLEQALGAYNAGPATVDEAGKVPDIPETRDYVKAILEKVQAKRADPPSSPTPKPTEN